MFESEDIIKIENKYFFAAKDINAICSFDENDGIIKILRNDPSGDIWAYRRYGRIFKYEDMLIFPPLWASTFLIFYIKEQRFETINLKPISGYNFDYFFSGQIVDGKLILAGCQYPAICVLNLSDLTVEYYEEPYYEMLEIHGKGKDCFFRNDMVAIGDKIYLASCITNKVLEFSILDGSYIWHVVGDKENKYSGLAWDGKNFWLASRREYKILKWNPETGKLEEFSVRKESENIGDDKKCTFLGVVYDGKRVIFPGMQINKTVIINPKTNEMTINNSSYLFYIFRDGLNYGLTAEGLLEIYEPGEYEKPVRIIKTKNDNTLRARLICETGEMIHEGYKGIQLADFLGMVKE